MSVNHDAMIIVGYASAKKDEKKIGKNFQLRISLCDVIVSNPSRRASRLRRSLYDPILCKQTSKRNSAFPVRSVRLRVRARHRARVHAHHPPRASVVFAGSLTRSPDNTHTGTFITKNGNL
jgi:hypothetical protein